MVLLCDLCATSAYSAVTILRMSHDTLTKEIIGAAIKVHRKLGPAVLESAYEACLAYELDALGKKVERQKPVPLFYEQIKLDCGFRADLVVENRIVVELKCKDDCIPLMKLNFFPISDY